ncbi:DNA mismatch repair protein Msh1 [Piedraia hortae CBS 480.64]|uniref:DNA mismatch repair protein Msh1 n=1 Tax=Piedraia hortae CBS 480.64 TaxID=1314780 RepID=A0A6A7BU54_9PEZI|nr:DNA mismatch repair protein Msh1 [Piedraia hortae CBS 480.64]
MCIRRGCHFAACNRSSLFNPLFNRQLSPSLATGPFLFFSRGAKRRTVLKASSLPLGALAPLQPVDAAEAKTYPTVLQQHLNNVRKYQDCVVLTRVGDFYEMYFDQVPKFAPLVNLKQAKRTTALGDVPMAGFQHTQLDRYLKMFVRDLGQPVAIAEQFRLPNTDKDEAGGPMYDRKVTRIVTAGTLIDETFIDPSEHNFLMAIHLDTAVLSRFEQNSCNEDDEAGISWVDLSSGDFYTQTCNLGSIPSLLARVSPSEVVLDSRFKDLSQDGMQRLLGEGSHHLHFHTLTQPLKPVAEWTPTLERAVTATEAATFKEAEVAAGHLVLEYSRDRLIDAPIKLQAPIRRSNIDAMTIDSHSLRGLEVRSTLRDGTFQGSLLHAVRRTVTKSGARLLDQRLVAPSMSFSVINNRLDLVQEFKENDAMREDIRALLRRTADIRRLLQKFSVGRGDADDLLALAKSIDVMTEITDVVRGSGDGTAATLAAVSRLDMEGPSKLARDIQKAIDVDGLNQSLVAEIESSEGEESEMVKPPRKTTNTRPVPDSALNGVWIMRRDASPTLKQAHDQVDKLLISKDTLSHSLRKALGTETLTLKWSGQLGHFCHIKGKDTKGRLSSLSGVRSIGSTKSTLSFYITSWTQLGSQIDSAKLLIRAAEDSIFETFRTRILTNLPTLRRNASILDELDVATSSATLAREQNLTRPILDNSTTHQIINGRHPTVTLNLISSGRQFTPNDCNVGSPNKIYLITGPNMAGKSTYLRQNALLTILAQTGLFLPCDFARIGLVDKIFSRVGSSDSLHRDQSTFMVEMLETASILKNATRRSFVIMDEVGRGTTPEDGLAIAFACLRYLHEVNRARVLFATHFHGVETLVRRFLPEGGVEFWCTDLQEREGGWVYVHRLRRGVNRQSHALKVARLAGLPEEAVKMAGRVLEEDGR